MRFLPLIFSLWSLVAHALTGPIKVVASFTVIKDFVQNVGGDRVSVSAIVGPNGDPHSYTPTPSDVQRISEAAVVFVNGLHLDSWMKKLVSSVGKCHCIRQVTHGVTPRVVQEEHGAVSDPHAWHDPESALIYIDNIANELCVLDPEYAQTYRKNAERYKQEVLAVHHKLKALFATIPERYRIVLTAHEGFGYFGRAYDINFLAPMGMSTEEEVRPRDMATLIKAVRELKMHTLFSESISNDKVVQQIATEGGAQVGHVLYSDSLSEPCGEAPTYLAMLQHNALYVFASMQDMQSMAGN